MQSLRLSYKLFGSGTKPIIAFHGFGQDADSWIDLSTKIGESYRIIAIEAPWHGAQVAEKIETKNAIAPINLANAVHQIIVQENADGATIICYSLGARIALNYLSFYPEAISNLILLAPDGLKSVYWRSLATQTMLGRFLFKSTMEHPGWLLGIVKLSAGLRLIPASVKKFVFLQLKPASNRRRLYATWTSLRCICPKTLVIIAHQTTQKTEIHLIMGTRDTIISPKSARKLLRTCPDIRYHEIQSGHFLLNDAGLEVVRKVLHSPKTY